MESDEINFVVGTKINQAHHDPSLPIEIEIRKSLVKRMVELLENKYMKENHILLKHFIYHIIFNT